MLLYLSVKQTRTKYAGIFRRSAKMLAKASMRNTNFKKYAGISKRSQRGGLENLSVYRTQMSRNPLKILTISRLRKMQKLAHLT